MPRRGLIPPTPGAPPATANMVNVCCKRQDCPLHVYFVWLYVSLHASAFCSLVVNMSSFLEEYIAWQIEMDEALCTTASATCANECYAMRSTKCYKKRFNTHCVNTTLCSTSGITDSVNACSNCNPYMSNAY